MAREQGGDADYYRAYATEMMTKAQAASSKAVRRAYLNLAQNWAQEAGFSQDGLSDASHPPVAPAIPQKA